MRFTLSTHVLDTAAGRPAEGVRVTLYRNDVLLASTSTNVDGRTDVPLLTGDAFEAGAYRLEFGVGAYFGSRASPDARRFLDVVPIAFIVDEPERGYHVPLLCSPWSYSTYRGS